MDNRIFNPRLYFLSINLIKNIIFYKYKNRYIYLWKFNKLNYRRN